MRLDAGQATVLSCCLHKGAVGSSAKEANQADESTTFKLGRPREQLKYRCLWDNHATLAHPEWRWPQCDCGRPIRGLFLQSEASWTPWSA